MGAWAWWYQPDALARMMLFGAEDNMEEPASVHKLDYEQCYHLFDYIGYPWVLDTRFSGLFHLDEKQADNNAIMGFMEDWMYESDTWTSTAPEGWLPLDARPVPYYPYWPTEEILRVYLRGEIQDAIDKLEEIDGQIDTVPLDELDWERHDDDDMDELSDLLFKAQDFEEGTSAQFW